MALLGLVIVSACIAAQEPPAQDAARRLLLIPVRFPDAAPSRTIDEIAEKARRTADYIQTASYGRATMDVRVLGWQDLPDPLAEYSVSPHNYEVDRERVRRLVTHALSAASRSVSLRDIDCAAIVVGVHTEPGTGYGMIAYAANPGMLTGVRGARARLETIRLEDGSEFDRGVVVCAENAHVGHLAHDLLHVIGGVREGTRAVPDLYDYDLQSRPPDGTRVHPSTFAVHAGPWDIMSQHFLRWDLPPPPPSSFTRLRLGWIGQEQVVTVPPGETRTVTLAPLESGQGTLVVRIPVGDRRYFLLENRRPSGLGAVLPADGLLILEVNEGRGEGAGIVRVADANPSQRNFRGAPFTPGSRYENSRDGFAVSPVAREPEGALQVLVTTPAPSDP